VASPAAMTSHTCLFDYHCLLVSMEEECQDEGDEEKYDVHDTKHPGRFEHGAILVDVGMPSATANSKDPQVDVDGT
jgi:hypothetical protein